MLVTLAEFKKEVDRYLELVGDEKIVITKDGQSIAEITPPVLSKATLIQSLRGTLPATATLEEARNRSRE